MVSTQTRNGRALLSLKKFPIKLELDCRKIVHLCFEILLRFVSGPYPNGLEVFNTVWIDLSVLVSVVGNPFGFILIPQVRVRAILKMTDIRGAPRTLKSRMHLMLFFSSSVKRW